MIYVDCLASGRPDTPLHKTKRGADCETPFLIYFNQKVQSPFDKISEQA
jgi:hypothetical protein